MRDLIQVTPPTLIWSLNQPPVKAERAMWISPHKNILATLVTFPGHLSLVLAYALWAIGSSSSFVPGSTLLQSTCFPNTSPDTVHMPWVVTAECRMPYIKCQHPSRYLNKNFSWLLFFSFLCWWSWHHSAILSLSQNFIHGLKVLASLTETSGLLQALGTAACLQRSSQVPNNVLKHNRVILSLILH